MIMGAPPSADQRDDRRQANARGCLFASILLAATSWPALSIEPDSSGFPGDDFATMSPAQAGWDEGALQQALLQAQRHLSTGVILLKDGKIVAERYWPLPDLDAYPPALAAGAKRMLYGHTDEGYPLEDVASVQKSVVAVLAAIAVERGSIDYDDPVDQYLGNGWARITPAQSHAITIRHLMTQTSGLSNALEWEAAPGTKWRYNTAAYQNVLRVLAAASDMDANTLTGKWLTRRIGMSDTRWVERTWANVQPPMMGLVTTPRDLARFGLLVMHRGRWAGEQIVPASRMDELLRPGQELNPAYGMLWWLNTEAGYLTPRSARLRPGKRIADAPPDMVAAAGALDRYVFILPTEKVVIVRTGLVNPEARRGNDEFDKSWWHTLSGIFRKGPP